MPTYAFLQSGEAQIITVGSGSISTVCSLLVISIILRSPSRLSSSYHKIMFSLCCWDTISSIAIALSTLPMSKDVLDFYAFEGIVLGNADTCTAQAFAITAGQTFAILSNVTLNIYYVSTIRYKMTDRTVKKKLLPIMVAFSCLVGFPVCITPLVMDLYNPRPFEPYCYIGSYPYRCNWRDNDDMVCIRGDVSSETESKVILVVMLGLMAAFFMLVVSSVLVVISVFQTEMTLRRMRKEQAEMNQNRNGIYDAEKNQVESYNDDGIATSSHENDHGTNHNDNNRSRNRRSSLRTTLMDEFKETRMVLRIALMYIGAFFITWFWTIITIVTNDIPDNSFWSLLVDYGKLICSPSQGTFNALIFIYNKIHTARKANPNLTFIQALEMVIFTPSTVPEVLVTSLDMVNEDMHLREENQRVQELIEDDLEREDQEVSAISPASIPSNFGSADTPSFALSNTMSSQGIDKEMEAWHKKDGDPNDTRRFYAATPEDMLHWAGDTRQAAVYLEQNLGTGFTSSSSTVPTSRHNQGIAHPAGFSTNPRSRAGGSSNRSGASSVFTLNSLQSFFSSAPHPSINSRISEGTEEEDKDANEDDHGEATAEETSSGRIPQVDSKGLSDRSEKSNNDDLSLNSFDA